MRWRFAVLVLALATMASSYPLYQALRQEFTPGNSDEGEFEIGLTAKEGTSLTQMEEVALMAERDPEMKYYQGSLLAWRAPTMRLLVGYSSLAHLGFIVLGIMVFDSMAAQGAVLQMINHGVSTGALFLLVGMIYERRHTRQIAELKGLQKVAPIFAAAFTVVMLSSIGEWTGKMRSTPTPFEILRTVNVSDTPAPRRAMQTPSKAWRRSLSPSRTRTFTRSVSPERKGGTSRVHSFWVSMNGCMVRLVEIGSRKT